MYARVISGWNWENRLGAQCSLSLSPSEQESSLFCHCDPLFAGKLYWDGGDVEGGMVSLGFLLGLEVILLTGKENINVGPVWLGENIWKSAKSWKKPETAAWGVGVRLRGFC